MTDTRSQPSIVERLRRGATHGVLIPCEDLIEAAERIQELEGEVISYHKFWIEERAKRHELESIVELLEKNAREQAKLLADTGRRVEKLTTALQVIEGAPFSMVNDAESLRHTIKGLQATARAALSSVEAVK